MDEAAFHELVARRQSDRDYDAGRAVEKEKIVRILEAGRLAPSACNSQPWHFVVVDDPAIRGDVAKAMMSLGMNQFAASAPCFILIVQESPNFSARLGGWIKNKHFPYRLRHCRFLLDACRDGRRVGKLHHGMVRRKSIETLAWHSEPEKGVACCRVGLFETAFARQAASSCGGSGKL